MAQANMEVAERIKAAREKSLRLMRMDKQMDSFVKQNQGTINENIESNVSPIQSNAQIPEQPRVNATPIRNTGRLSESASKLPREVLESFQNNVIDESKLLDGIMGDGNSLSMLTEGVPQKRQTSSMPKEIANAYGTPQHIQEAQQPMNVVQTQVDYPMIKMIVEDIVKKYTSALQKKMLNESVGSSSELSTFTIGKTFKFLDKSGNIFEATLKKIGNINDKKQ